MLRKILAVLLVFTMLIGIVPTTAFAQTEETIVADTTIIETSEKVVAKQEVEDCTVQFEYLKDSEESFLSIGEDRYKLDVLQTDDSVLVSISEDYENVYETKVVAQAATASIAVGLFTVTIVYAAKDIIIAGLTAAQKAASPRKRGAPHGSHYSGDGYYPHFHPQGVKWKSNKSHEPHCWYPT